MSAWVDDDESGVSRRSRRVGDAEVGRGVWGHNGAYLIGRKPVLLDELRHLRAVLAGDSTASKSEMRTDPSAAECRMNAGFVKIYSLLCEHCVIYGGRVGAAGDSSSDSSVKPRIARRFLPA